jgi:predicted secreted protein
VGVFPSIVTFVIIWWTVLFVVLPLGLSRASTTTAPEGPLVPGADPGAPRQVDMRRKFVLTTVITAAIWLGVFIVATAGWFDLEAMSLAALSRGS